VSEFQTDIVDESEMLTCAAQAEDNNQRLDKVLALRFPDLSRSRLKALILEGEVSVDEQVCLDPSRKVKEGMVLTLAVPPPLDAVPEPENIPLSIVYEDDALLVIDKQAGLVVHPGAGNYSGTLVNALLYHCGDTLSGIGGVRRPGIVHRLDKDTTGLMVVAKSDAAHQALSDQLADRTLGRHYKALVWGKPQLSKGFVDQPIGRHPTARLKMTVTRKNGREAVTHYVVDTHYGDAASLLTCRLESGRTHQVRVHMAYIKHPLIGDPLYGLQDNAGGSLLRRSGYGQDAIGRVLAFPRQALHAWKIHFVHPLTEEEMEFEAPIPQDMTFLINLLES